MQIDDTKRAEYYKRVYESIDGLWFMMLEQDRDFEYSLEIDRRVWEVVPKIQARKIRELFGIDGNGPEALSKALEIKFRMDHADAEVSVESGSLHVKITSCPWYHLMEKSGRRHLAEKVGLVICGVEYPAWMKEFGVDGAFIMDDLLCGGAPACRMRFDFNE